MYRGMSRDRHAGADVASLEGALLGHEIDLGHGEAMGRGREARSHCRAAPSGDAIGKLHGLDRAGHLERILDAAAGCLADDLDHVGRASVVGLGRAELRARGRAFIRQSMATIVPRPAAEAPSRALSPTPPRPTTATWLRPVPWQC